MKKVLKWASGLVVVLLLFILAALGYVKFGLPDAGDPPNLKIDATPELLARGRYLANHVTVCLDCHSDHDYNYYAAPIVPGTEGKGGFKMEEPGVGDLYPSNITPTALGNWTDGEIFRAIVSGVDRDGEPLFPMMPYLIYREMSERDIHAIIAYLRTLEPIENEVPDSKINFP